MPRRHTPPGGASERTGGEWQASVSHQAPGGVTDGQRHMPQSADERAAAQVDGAPKRRMHAHGFAGVDVALTPFPQAAEQRQLVQGALDATRQSALCAGGSLSRVSFPPVAPAPRGNARTRPAPPPGARKVPALRDIDIDIDIGVGVGVGVGVEPGRFVANVGRSGRAGRR